LLDTNLTSAALWTLALLKEPPGRLPFTLVAIVSVAGDRGGRAISFMAAAQGRARPVFWQA